MEFGLCRVARRRGIGLALGLVVLSGCAPGDVLQNAGVTLKPPDGWKSVAATTWAVPGKALAAWSGPGGSSLVVYRTLPVPEGGKARDFLTALVNRLENLPGYQVVERRLDKVGGAEAARVEVLAPGTGDALAPSGSGTPYAAPGVTLQPTRRVIVTVPRESDTLTFEWHTPEADAANRSAVDTMLAGATIDRGRLAVSSY